MQPFETKIDANWIATGIATTTTTRCIRSRGSPSFEPQCRARAGLVAMPPSLTLKVTKSGETLDLEPEFYWWIIIVQYTSMMGTEGVGPL